MNKLFAAAVLAAVLSAHAANHDVQMLNVGKDGSMVFEPAVVQAKIGDTVTFRAATKGHFVQSHAVPEGAQPFSSEEDEELVVKLTHEGVYVYNCPPHRMMNMSGLIQVGKAVNLQAAQTAAAELDKKAMQNKTRMAEYLKQIK